MSRPRRRLRTRLLVAMVAIAFGVLVVAAAGAAVLARETAADSAIDDLEERAPELASLVGGLGAQIRSQPAAVAGARRLQQTLVALLAASGTSTFTINADGSVTEGAGPLLGRPGTPIAAPELELPDGLEVAALDLEALAAGRSESGVQGDRAYVAVPLTPVDDATPVVVVTSQVEQRPLGRAGPFLLVTGALALLAAALVSAFLARRMTRPIAAMEAAANRIAEGDLSARVDADGLRDDELAGLTRSFNAMAAELETARSHERRFLMSVSHDLRTPLTSIRGYAEALEDGTVSEPDARVRAARIIETEARRLERLVADLLDLARLDAHEFSLTPRPVDARDVVATTVAGFQPSARDYDLTLTMTPGDPIPADVDPERLAQIVANLVENALKYARTTVSVTIERTPPVITLRVADDGPGIPEDERAQVFARLSTARPVAGRPVAGRPVGTGIGLAIVRELAHAMGGSATCDGEPSPAGSPGAVFTVTIGG